VGGFVGGLQQNLCNVWYTVRYRSRLVKYHGVHLMTEQQLPLFPL